MAEETSPTFWNWLLGGLGVIGASALGVLRFWFREKRASANWLIDKLQETIDSLEEKYSALERRLEALQAEHVNCHVQLASARLEINSLKDRVHSLESEVKRG